MSQQLWVSGEGSELDYLQRSAAEIHEIAVKLDNVLAIDIQSGAFK